MPWLLPRLSEFTWGPNVGPTVIMRKERAQLATVNDFEGPPFLAMSSQVALLQTGVWCEAGALVLDIQNTQVGRGWFLWLALTLHVVGKSIGPLAPGCFWGQNSRSAVKWYGPWTFASIMGVRLPPASQHCVPPPFLRPPPPPQGSREHFYLLCDAGPLTIVFPGSAHAGWLAGCWLMEACLLARGRFRWRGGRVHELMSSEGFEVDW